MQFNLFSFKSTKSGQLTKLVDLSDYLEYGSNDKQNSNLIQTFNSGFRISSQNIDYKYWNGTVFIDIDSKKFKLNDKLFFGSLDRQNKFVPDENKENVFNNFYKVFLFNLNTITKTLYCAQQSSSKYSFHIIFYFDCERNEDNFKRAQQKALNFVNQAAKASGKDIEQIISYPGVLDTCTQSIGQGIYITKYPITFFNYDGIAELDDVVIEDEELTNNEILFKSNYYSINDKFELLPNYEYSIRWKLSWIIYNYFNFDENKCLEVFYPIAKHISLHRDEYSGDKGINELINQFRRDLHNSKGKKYNFNTALIEWCKNNLGFKININKTFIPIDLKDSLYDEIITLKDNQTVSDIIVDVIKNDHIICHIDAGCGDGKTYSAKYLANIHNNIDSIDALFFENQIKALNGYSICFVTPMKSINKDSFENNINWQIVDSDHPNFDSNCKNIVTTWDSFYKRKMYDHNFDVVIFDEIHSLYLYEYRINAITNIKKCINILKDKCIKTILFTGTPGFETKEFQCYKIKINKEKNKVPCDIVFYNDNYIGWLTKDIKEFINNKNNKVVVFNDRTNWQTEESYKKRGISDVFVYNSKYNENVEMLTTTQKLQNKVTLISVYGQAGINIYGDKNEKIRLYCTPNNAMSIVQYLNRIRNKECIDKVVVLYKKSNISNKINKINDCEFNEIENLIEVYNKAYQINDDPISLLKSNLVKINFGIKFDYIEKDYAYGTIKLNKEKYITYDRIIKTIEYEKQLQIIYNRLKQNFFEPNFVYLNEDEKDEINTKYCLRTFTGNINRLFGDLSKFKINENNIWLDIKNTEYNNYMTGNLKETIEFILSYYYKKYNDKDKAINKLVDFISKCITDYNKITKSDFTDLKNALFIFDEIYNKYDGYYLKLLFDESWGLNKVSSYYFGTLNGIDKLNSKQFSEALCETVDKFKYIKKIYSKFNYMFDLDLDSLNREIPETNLIIARKCMEILEVKNSKKCNKSKSLEFEGKLYSSIVEAYKATGKSRNTIKKYAKYI